MHTESLRVIAFKEGDAWVAQGLEVDIGAQAPTLDELTRRFETTILEEGPSFDQIGPAPQFYFDLWDKAEDQPIVSESGGGHPYKISKLKDAA